MELDAQFLEYVVKALVDNPADVKINRTVDEMGVLLTLEVSPLDMGKIIGRSGNTAKAIRTLLRVVGMKNNARVNLKINEPEGSTRPERNTERTERVERVERPAERPKTDNMRSVDEVMEDLKL